MSTAGADSAGLRLPSVSVVIPICRRPDLLACARLLAFLDDDEWLPAYLSNLIVRRAASAALWGFDELGRDQEPSP